MIIWWWRWWRRPKTPCAVQSHPQSKYILFRYPYFKGKQEINHSQKIDSLFLSFSLSIYLSFPFFQKVLCATTIKINRQIKRNKTIIDRKRNLTTDQTQSSSFQLGLLSPLTCVLIKYRPTVCRSLSVADSVSVCVREGERGLVVSGTKGEHKTGQSPHQCRVCVCVVCVCLHCPVLVRDWTDVDGRCVLFAST